MDQFGSDIPVGSMAASWVIGALVGVLMIVAMWMMFQKAGKPGWAAIIPIYNIIVFCQVAGKPGWWVVLFLIPIANIVFYIITSLSLAKNFGKSGAFGFFLVFLLSFIGIPILGFGKAQYQGKAA